MPKRNTNNKRKQRRNRPRSTALAKQISDVDYYVVDSYQNISDTANTAFDLYTQIASSTDYTNILASYGQLQWFKVEFIQVPYFQYSGLSTDYAIGAFGTRQGVFDTTVTTKSSINIVREPGSQMIQNKTSFHHTYPIAQKNWFPSNMTNTIVSDVPKFNFYYGWDIVASTNTGGSRLHIKLHLNAKCKID